MPNKGIYVTTAQRDNWRTPPALFNLLNRHYRFTIDAAADRDNALLTRFWTEHEDGIAQSWKGERVFCNPPFSQKRHWAEKAAWREADICVMILPATVDQMWFHEFVIKQNAEILIPRGRILFVPPPGMIQKEVKEASSPRFASVIAVFTKEIPRVAVVRSLAKTW